MMQSSDSHNWLVVTSLVIYCRLFLVDNAQVVLFSKMMPFSEVFQRMRTERTMYHVLSCHVAVDPTRSQSGFVCFTSAGRKKGRRLWLRKIWHLHVARL